MGKFIIRVKQSILILSDILLFYASMFVEFVLRYQHLPSAALWKSHLVPFSTLLIIWLIVFFSNGLYDLTRLKNEAQFYKRLFQVMGINLFLSISFFYLIPYFDITPKTNLFLTIFVFTALQLGWRSLFNAFIRPHLFKRRVLFVGDITKLPELKLMLGKDTGIGSQVVAVIDPREVEKERLKQEGIDCYADITKLRSVVDIKNIQSVIVGPDFVADVGVQKELYELVSWGTEIQPWNTVYEELLGRIPIHALSESWFWNNIHESSKKWYDALRTVVDVALAIILLVIFIVLLPFVAAAVMLETGRPIFYKQKRVGEKGVPFFLYKVRSMKKLSADGGAELEGPEFVRDNDARVTRVGRFIRATRIDELPQALNVIQRQMNFIGPRPERPEFVERLQEEMPYFSMRHLVKPGITGWAQVNNPLHSSLKENLVKLEYDLYYIKNRSFLLDLIILLRTFAIIVRGIGK